MRAPQIVHPFPIRVCEIRLPTNILEKSPTSVSSSLTPSSISQFCPIVVWPSNTIPGQISVPAPISTSGPIEMCSQGACFLINLTPASCRRITFAFIERVSINSKSLSFIAIFSL